jgi:hypothetical protein
LACSQEFVAGSVAIHGTLRGPFCETAKTLPASFEFRPVLGRSTATAEVYVPDPCVWSPELPHLYEIDVEARRGDEVVAAYHGSIGLRNSDHGNAKGRR